MLKKIGSNDFDNLDFNGLVVVDFMASWCSPCQRLMPIMEQISEEYENVTFVKVDVDESPDISGRYGVMGLPNIVFLKDGEVVAQEIGVFPKGKYVDIIEQNK